MLLLALAACVSTPIDDTNDGSSTTATEQSTSDGPSTSSDSGGGSTETSAGSDTEGTVQHATCMQPFPAPAPALPEINAGPDGTPRFADWEDIDCGSVMGSSCTADAECPESFCLGSPLGTGVCTTFYVDIWCDGEGEVIGYGNGTCWMCAPVDAHAVACCEKLEGFDCRSWPFPGDSAPGMICARHEDCEPGLVCGSHAGAGYGICMCPEVDGTGVTPANGCA